MKATFVEVNGEGRAIFKDPITDDGTKKSAKGLIKVFEENGTLTYKDECTLTEEKDGLLTTVFKDGKLLREQSLQEIRTILTKQLQGVNSLKSEVFLDI
jgi:nicotinamide phosphoribosyltransferase